MGLRASWEGPRARWEAELEGMEAQLERSEGQLRGGRADERMNERMENLPILQDFVPYRDRCPKSV